jgi:hypothetical protein
VLGWNLSGVRGRILLPAIIHAHRIRGPIERLLGLTISISSVGRCLRISISRIPRGLLRCESSFNPPLHASSIANICFIWIQKTRFVRCRTVHRTNWSKMSNHGAAVTWQFRNPSTKMLLGKAPARLRPRHAETWPLVAGVFVLCAFIALSVKSLKVRSRNAFFP